MLRDFTRTLTAGQVVHIDAPGNTVMCTAADAVFVLEPDGNNRHELNDGLGARYQKMYGRWQITNGATAQTITLYIGDDEVINNRQSGSIAVSAITDPVAVAVPGTYTPLAVQTIGVAASQVNSASATRQAWLFKAARTNTDAIWLIGTSTFITGYPLYAGESIALSYDGVMKAISGTAGQLLYTAEVLT